MGILNNYRPIEDLQNELEQQTYTTAAKNVRTWRHLLIRRSASHRIRRYDHGVGEPSGIQVNCILCSVKRGTGGVGRELAWVDVLGYGGEQVEDKAIH